MAGVFKKPFERIRSSKKRLLGASLILAAVGLCAKSISVASKASAEIKRSSAFLDLSPANSNSSDFMVDVLSVGSVYRSDLQEAQESIIAAAPFVRNWVPLTEHDDFEQMCAASMTAHQLGLLWTTCKETIWIRKIAQTMRGELFRPHNHTGWVCAQKRPIDGLYQMLDRYRTTKEALPNYLIIIDDDTYINAPALVKMLRASYKDSEPKLLSGCRTILTERQQITYPTSGYGTILSKKAIQNILRPIRCEASTMDPFSVYACWRLSMNIMGEQVFFREGMSLIDLIGAYSKGFEFSQVHTWKMRTGYCLTSDLALGYFLVFYHVGVPDASFKTNPNDFTRKKHGFEDIAQGQCHAKCSLNSLLCHGASATQMVQLFRDRVITKL